MDTRRRRKSISGIFRPSILGLTPIHDESPHTAPLPNSTRRKLRPASFFAASDPSAPSSPDPERQSSQSGLAQPSSPKTRPRTLVKSSRPPSIFGSLRSLNSVHDEDEDLVRTNSRSSLAEESPTLFDTSNMVVLHHGEVQTAGGVFRRKNQYLVLTNTHLLRFKSQARASEVFPSIPASLGRSSSIRHSRMSSSGSLHEMHNSADSQPGIPLSQIVGVYRLDDGRPYFSVEIAQLDEEVNYATTMILQLNDPRESDLWLSSIRAATTKARLTDPQPFARQSVECAARALEHDFDYDPKHFKIFKVVKRAGKNGGRSSSDDLAKLTSCICFLVIGIHKIHLVPLPRSTKQGSSTSLAEMIGVAHGLTTLTSLTVQSSDDAFQLTFRVPLEPTRALHLASSCVNDIAMWIRQAAEYLRPEWVESPYTWNVPRSLDDELLPVTSEGEDHFCFDRTLAAYCSGYEVNASNICYTVNYHCEDAPRFVLLPPANTKRTTYTLLELLAILRSLRYNESFHSIEFCNMSLDTLHNTYDPHEGETQPLTTRFGDPVHVEQPYRCCLLRQEVQALALKSKRLRRLDFSYSLLRKPKESDSYRDAGSGVCEAIFPLCAQQYTNVDWINLTGLILSDVDLDYLYAAAIDKSCHFRAVELGQCALTDQRMRTILQAMVHQEDTLESLDLSGNPARLDPDVLRRHMDRFGFIRSLNLSNIQLLTKPEPLVAAETLFAWRLECLNLGRTTLNGETVRALTRYFASTQSNTLREIFLHQCHLTGEDAAALLHTLGSKRQAPRQLHLYMSENRLEQGHELLVDAFRQSLTPSHVTMQMLEYKEEKNFRSLLQALAGNKSTKYLDISKISLPFDASNETCQTLRRMFEQNDTLEELDISGEQAHLEAVTLGSGVNDALIGLCQNKSLRVLRVEHQCLGLQGASALASVLESNDTLLEVYCDNNEINLQAFTVLVKCLEHNKTLQYLPAMDNDRIWSRKRVDREVADIVQTQTSHNSSLPHTPSSSLPPRTTVKRTLGAAISSSRTFSSRSIDRVSGHSHVPPGGSSPRSSTYGGPVEFTEKDVRAAVANLSVLWDRQVLKLQMYLKRNYCLANGLDFTPDLEWESMTQEQRGIYGVGEENSTRPNSAGSLSGMLRQATLDRTPTAEQDLQLGVAMTTSSTVEKENEPMMETLNEKMGGFELGPVTSHGSDENRQEFGSHDGNESGQPPTANIDSTPRYVQAQENFNSHGLGVGMRGGLSHGHSHHQHTASAGSGDGSEFNEKLVDLTAGGDDIEGALMMSRGVH
ncbi:hypothetical protein MMC09_002310 [Bachmanniomyces sp. S44760]|nr:hypothetical protein [Bachmanniomyces sp. S44760]